EATWADSPGSSKLRGYVIEYSGPRVKRTVGHMHSSESSTPGYSLHNPLGSKFTYLIDRRGRVANSWTSDYIPGAVAYLQPNGRLLRAGRVGNANFVAGGSGGILEELDWLGHTVWEYKDSDSNHCAHHDVEVLPNGNILILAWQRISEADAIAAGRDPALISQGWIWPESIIEIDPHSNGGRIVWEWHSWDHIIQDFDASKKNSGPVAQHPELIDVNYAIDSTADWQHANSLDYNPALDQIMISVRTFDEIWIIDHSPTTQQARGHSGGRSGMGGDLLYRWGNPATYRAGGAAARTLYRQHDAHWIPKGLPGAGNVLIFNNGDNRPNGDFSSVDEIVLPPRTSRGTYARPGAAYGPAGPIWSFQGKPRGSFYSAFVSGAQRLPNGNTFICAGTQGLSLEVTPAQDVVWLFRNPVTVTGPLTQGTVPAETFGPRGTPVFRSPLYAPDYPALKRNALFNYGPIEKHEQVLLVEGSTAPAFVRLGETADFTLRAKGSENRAYIVATSITEGVYPLDTRFVRLGMDPILILSAQGGAPATFRHYLGRLNAQGGGAAAIVVPNLPGLVGLEMYTAFVAHSPAAPSGLGFISNTVKVTIVR
ncbi:MAG: aryl-sulfate sulfotransferase, partial [Planctomycetota bacterium]|nr:aryl-sulfate sulfotransferase [Planctomycetota bacterium]